MVTTNRDPNRPRKLCDMSWAAGFIDARGRFSIRETTTTVIVRGRKEDCERLHRILGGQLRTSVDAESTEKSYWCIPAGEQEHILGAISPYLTSAYKDASKILKYRGTIQGPGRKKVSNNVLEFRNDLRKGE